MSKIITIGKFPPQDAVLENSTGTDDLISWLPVGEFSVDGITYLATCREADGHVTKYQTNYGAMFSIKTEGNDDNWRSPFYADDDSLREHRHYHPVWADLEWTPGISP